MKCIGNLKLPDAPCKDLATFHFEGFQGRSGDEFKISGLGVAR